MTYPLQLNYYTTISELEIQARLITSDHTLI